MVDYKKTGLMKAGMVTCCGQVVSLDASEVQRIMCERGLSPAEQAQEWLRLMRRHAEPEWMELCMRSAERMAALVRAEREVQAVVGTTVDSASGGEGRRMPSEGLAPRHFEWLGAQQGVRVDLVRTAISSLVQMGYIGSDAEQQAALSACYQTGYRLAMIWAGAGALWLAGATEGAGAAAARIYDNSGWKYRIIPRNRNRNDACEPNCVAGIMALRRRTGA